MKRKIKVIGLLAGGLCLLSIFSGAAQIFEVTQDREVLLLDFNAYVTEPMGWGVVLSDITIQHQGTITTLPADGVIQAENSKVFECSGCVDKRDIPLSPSLHYRVVTKKRLGDILGFSSGSERVVGITLAP